MSDETGSSSEDERLSPTVCHLCRQRKTKCDRKLPKCGFCVKAKVDCQYVQRSQKRGLRAGYVSELEARIGILEREIEDLKNHNESPNTSFPRIVSVDPSVQQSPATTINLQQTPLVSTPSVSSVNTSAVALAIDHLRTLPHTFFDHVVDMWFKQTQMWVPILNREHIQNTLDNLPVPVDHIDDIELRALVAFKITYSTQAICIGYNGRRSVSQHLRSQVVVEAMANPSMSSLRALLIIALLDYGSDDIPSTFSLLAVCRRMCENIGMFRELLKRIESESPAQIGPPAVEMPSLDNTIPLTWCILALDAVSTLGVSWRDVSAALVDHLSSVAFISTPDFRDSFKTHTHLAAIGLQPVHEFFSAQARYSNALGDPLNICEEIYQNLISYLGGLPETSYTLLENGIIDFDICSIFTRVQVPGTIIMIYQRFILNEDAILAAIARQRCLESCDMLISTIRSISDADAEVNNSPGFATVAFVAARFKLIYYRTMGQSREPLFDILMHGINMLGRRWPLARRFDIVLRAAIIELDMRSETSLPREFWELNKSHLDISATLKEWVIQHVPSLYVGNLDGPYV